MLVPDAAQGNIPPPKFPRGRPSRLGNQKPAVTGQDITPLRVFTGVSWFFVSIFFFIDRSVRDGDAYLHIPMKALELLRDSL